MATGKGGSTGGRGGTGKLIGNAIKYGPLIAEGVRRYGPTLRDQVASNKDVLGEVVHQVRPGKRADARKNALAHAASVVDGSVMRCFHHACEYWVVFSGSEPIDVHPYTNIPYSELLRHADLSKRMTPEDEPQSMVGRAARSVLGAGRTPRRMTRPPRPRGSQQRPGSTGRGAQQQSPPVQPPKEEPIEGEIM